MKDSKKKILFVESQDVFGNNVKNLLEKVGYYEVTLAKGMKDGIDTMYKLLPHLVILDVILSDSNGYEFLQERVNEPMLMKIPLFLLSTNGIPINMQKVPEKSVTEFILMFNSDPNEIVGKVNKFFGNTVENDDGIEIDIGHHKKVLWVEDDKLIGSILKKKFISTGFDLTHVKDGETALRELENQIPDIIVLDILLPGVNGFEILAKVHSDPKTKNVPVIVLSNLSKPSDMERARTLGAKKFLVKAGVSLDQIIAEVKEFC